MMIFRFERYRKESDRIGMLSATWKITTAIKTEQHKRKKAKLTQKQHNSNTIINTIETAVKASRQECLRICLAVC